MSSIDRICADPGKYSFDVDRLGECKIASPIRHHEFIEDGVYHPVVRGFTNLDVVKDRKYWQWGDIYNHEASIMKWIYKEGVGLVEKEEEEEDEEDQEDL